MNLTVNVSDELAAQLVTNGVGLERHPREVSDDT